MSSYGKQAYGQLENARHRRIQELRRTVEKAVRIHDRLENDGDVVGAMEYRALIEQWNYEIIELGG